MATPNNQVEQFYCQPLGQEKGGHLIQSQLPLKLVLLSYCEITPKVANQKDRTQLFSQCTCLRPHNTVVLFLLCICDFDLSQKKFILAIICGGCILLLVIILASILGSLL